MDAEEIFDRRCYVETPLPYDEKVLVYYPNAIDAMEEYANQKVREAIPIVLQHVADKAVCVYPFDGNSVDKKSILKQKSELEKLLEI